MIKLYKSEALVLGRKNSGEADKIITIFTKFYGKKKVMAKGIRRIHSRRAPHLEPFSLIYLVIRSGNHFDYISEVTTLNNFSAVRSELWRTAYAYQLIELVDGFIPENVQNVFIYDLINKFLQQLDLKALTRKNADLLSFLFKKQLLSNLGFTEPAKDYSIDQMDHYINSLLERKLKSDRLLINI